MINTIISISLFVLCINLWIIINKIIKYYDNYNSEIDITAIVHIFMLVVTVTLPIFYDNEFYLSLFIKTIIPASIIFILYILFCIHCKSQKQLNDNRLLEYIR